MSLSTWSRNFNIENGGGGGEEDLGPKKKERGEKYRKKE
jgi:hypothetical protein